MEYLLPALLVEHAGEAVPRAILSMLTRKVDMHIQRLRRKLGGIRRPVHRNGPGNRKPDTVSDPCQSLRASRPRRVAGRVSLPPGTNGWIMAEVHVTIPCGHSTLLPSGILAPVDSSRYRGFASKGTPCKIAHFDVGCCAVTEPTVIS
jgi:hypothetical protein